MTSKKKKLLTAVCAVALAAVIAFGGTLAWQSISQQALNEAAATLNPGGRLHDDFDGRNKDVYVENFTNAVDGTPIFARVRLDEYMEIGLGAGSDRNLTAGEELTIEGLTVVGTGSKINDKSTWITRTPNSGLTDEAGGLYWNWDMDGGSTVYMPTFNKNKDSLKSDVNGTYDGDSSGTPYNDYATYTEGDTLQGEAVYDADSNNVEDENVDRQNETHTAKKTINGTVITMDEWLIRWEAYQLIENPTEEDTAKVMGDFWVWDADGWAYWANPIEPDTATGLLLDGIELTNPPSDSYYYGINVVGQFVTADDIGHLNGTGFYDTSDGKSTIPSENAESLIELITGTNIDITRVVVEANGGAASVNRGDSLQFTANVLKSNTEVINPEIVWSVEGGNSAATTVSESGVLSVGADEAAKELTIVATYIGADGNTTRGEIRITLTSKAAVVEIKSDSTDLTSVQPESEINFSAEVTRAGVAIEGAEVKWSISGNTDVNTVINPSSGINATLTLGANESRGPITVTASYADAETGQTITAVSEVTLNISVPLDPSISQEIVDAQITDLDKDDYTTVTIDGLDWYVLAVDEDRALIFAADAFTEGITNSETFTSWKDSTWRSYLNGDWLNSHELLKSAAIESTIKTRTVYHVEEWTETSDKVFLLTESDITGTLEERAVNIENAVVYNITAQNNDFTYGGKRIVPDAIILATRDFAVRSLEPHENASSSTNWGYRAIKAILASGDEFGEPVNISSKLPAYMRPALWVQLTGLENLNHEIVG